MSAYFDNNATTPLCDAARDAWIEAAGRFWHNPSSLYREAAEANRRLEDAREELGDLLGCEPDRIVFCAGATEANNAVLQFAAASDGEVWISAIEHPSVREPARRFFGRERVKEIPVNGDGSVASSSIPECAALVSVMAANNETGVLQPWQEIAATCRENEVPFHCDAAQWIGKIPARGLGVCDFVTGCAHKFGGPKGTGFLIVPETAERFESIVGGPQENGHRAGTEDLPGILAMLAALREKPDRELEKDSAFRLSAREAFEAAILDRIPGIEIVAPDSPRLWNTVMLIVPEHKNLKWLTRLDQRGFAVSTGSACSAGQGNPSHVMAAMGLDHGQMGRVIRVSGGWDTAEADWQSLARAFVEVHADLVSGKRDASPLLG